MASQFDSVAVSGWRRPDTDPYRRFRRFLPRILLFAAILLSGGAAAAAPAAIPAVGGATFTIDGRGDPTAARLCAAASGNWNVFDLLLDQPAKPPPEHVAVLGAVVNGAEPGGARDAIRLTVVDDPEPLLKLRICVDTDRLRSPGTWTVQGLVDWPGGSPAERSFAFSIVRRPAAVQVPAGLTLELASDGGFAPDGIPILETGGESGIHALTAVADPIETADSSAQIAFPAPVTIGPRGSAVLIPKLTGTLPLGVSTTRVTLSAPELGPPVAVTVRLARRRCVGWLLLILLAGVAAGYGTRVILANRNAKAVARLNATRDAARIEAMAAADQDPVVRQTLMQVIGALMADVDEAVLADTIDKAVTARRAEADAIVAEATRRREALRGQADALRAAYEPPGGLDPSLRFAEPIHAVLTELLKDIKGDLLFQSQQRLESFDRQATARLAPGFATWRGDLLTAFAHFNIWSMTAGPTDAAEALRAALEAEANLTLVKADTLAKEVREWLTRRLPGQTSRELRTLGDAFAEKDMAAAANLLRAAADRLDATPFVASAQTRLAQLVEEQAARRARLGEAIVALAPADAAGDVRSALHQKDAAGAAAAIQPPADTPLDTGSLATVLRAIVPDPAVRTMTGAAMGLIADGPVAGVPIVLPMRADFVIVGPTAGLLGTPIGLSLLIAPTADPQAAQQVEWLGNGVAVNPVDSTKATLTAPQAGFADVTVRFGGRAVARTTISIGAAAVRHNLMREILLEDIAGTLLSGAIAIFVGWVIFGAGWVGTGKDMAIALFWAYSLDLGLSRLRDIATLGAKAPGGGAA